MTRAIENVVARMIISQCQKMLERHAIMQIFAGTDLETNIHLMTAKAIENRSSATCQL